MASLFKTIVNLFQQKKTRRQLESWKRKKEHVHDFSIVRKYQLGDIFVDMYWYIDSNGQYRELLYRRHRIKDLKEKILHDEESVIPSLVDKFKANNQVL